MPDCVVFLSPSSLVIPITLYFTLLFLLPLSTLEHLKRWLQPDKVAISSEEMQYLIPLEAHMEKQESEEESMAVEQ